jgi:glycine cleavage system aminomethyltransferase T|tara:strand:- start:11737 stop:11913 length:177 start_codon:yes stop_codon:yes gene_type:complete
MAKNKEEIEALKEELKGYELYGKAERAKAVKEAIKAAGGKVETKTAKPKAEKKVEKKK